LKFEFFTEMSLTPVLGHIGGAPVSGLRQVLCRTPSCQMLFLSSESPLKQMVILV